MLNIRLVVPPYRKREHLKFYSNVTVSAQIEDAAEWLRTAFKNRQPHNPPQHCTLLARCALLQK